jgi:pentatricopeptide repeat protein
MVGNIHRKQHSFEKAVDYFSAAIKIAPDNAYAIFGMADALRGLGRYEQAAPYWDDIVRMDPGNKHVLTRAGDCYFRLGDLDRAEELFQRSLETGHDASALIGLSRVQRQRKQFDQAMGNYRRILERNPKDARTMALMGETLAEAEGPEAGLHYLKQMAKKHPEAKEIESALLRLQKVSAPHGKSR